MTKIILKESQIKGLIRMIKEQTDGEYYEISADDYMEFMRAASYSSKVTGMKKFKGKPLYIIGNVDLSHTPTTSLGNVAIITGNLDISNSKIADISKTDVKGNVRDYNSERERIRIRKEELKKLGEADGRREDGEWELDNPNIDEEGLAANALFNMLVNDGKLDEMDDETKELLKTKIEQLEQLKIRYEDTDGTLEPEEVSPLFDEISDLEDEIEELQEKYGDVYYIIPTNYKPYGTLYNFEVIGLRNQEYMVGEYDNMYDAAIENQEQLLDDVGVEGLSSWLIEDNLDKEQIRSEMEEYYEDDIRESPESYFDSDDYELTDEQEERKEQLENYINEMEDLKTEKEEELEELRSEYNPTEEDTQDYLYNEISDLEEEIEQIEENIEKAQDEFDSIEPDDEPTEEMIENMVRKMVRGSDEVDWLKELDRDLKEYVDLRKVAEDIVDSDGIGTLASYDGNYDDVTVKTTDGKSHSFVVMRMN
jgi:chromosome segregation ATPase